MSTFKTLMTSLVAGALLGEVVATLLASAVIPWWNTPGQGQAMCECSKIAHDTVTSLISYQLYGAAVGGVLFLVLGGFIVRARGQKLKATGGIAPSSGTP